MSDGLDHVFERITLRRAEILRELADGRTDKEIAAKLGISVNGVRSHVEDLREITGEPLSRYRAVVARWRCGELGQFSGPKVCAFITIMVHRCPLARSQRSVAFS